MKMYDRTRLSGLEGLRGMSCIAIILLHIQKNTQYNISGYIYNNIIGTLAWPVYIFLIISGFGMCLGYLKKFKEGKVDLESFYKKRYLKILPFFIILIMVNIITELSLKNIGEGIIEATISFGLLPNNNLNVIGVSWTLGVIFLFYMLFPFFTVLVKNKKRTWALLFYTSIIHILCTLYFITDNYVGADYVSQIQHSSFIYLLPLFVAGALIYHYLPKIKAFNRGQKIILLCITAVIAVISYIPINITDYSFFLKAILSSLLIICAISFDKSKLLTNKLIQYIGSISFEMYLSHMIIFRLLEKIHLLYVFGDNVFSYIFTSLLVIIILIIGLKIYRVLYKKFSDLLKQSKIMRRR